MAAVDYIMKHEDHHDKALSHLISIVKTPAKSKKLVGVYRLSKHNEKIRVLKCAERF